MDDQLALFIVIMTVVVAIAVFMLSWMKGRQRLAELNAGTRQKLEAAREIELLSDENAGLRGQVGRLEERIAVIERIATDPAERTAREIEMLR